MQGTIEECRVKDKERNDINFCGTSYGEICVLSYKSYVFLLLLMKILNLTIPSGTLVMFKHKGKLLFSDSIGLYYQYLAFCMFRGIVKQVHQGVRNG